MPRRPPLGLLLVGLLVGCSDSDLPVPVSPPSVVAECSSLITALPRELPQGLSRRSTAPASRATAAWGDPPITLRCGVPQGSVRDELFTFNDLEWAMHDIGSSRQWTSRGLRTNVEVVVPDDYSSQAELLGVLSRPVLQVLGR